MRENRELWNGAETVLLRAEGVIRLLDRLAPENGPAERERWRAAFARGESVEAELRYAPAPNLDEVRRSLDQVAQRLSDEDSLSQAYAERAVELELEAALVTALGTPRLRVLSCRRFDPRTLHPPAEVEQLVERWLSGALPLACADRVASDDAAHPESLLNLLRAAIGVRSLPVRVELNPALSAVAAAGESLVAVRPGVLLSPEHARRIVQHELEAHVLPRLAARGEAIGLFRTGCRGAGDEEEGRAILIEERGGFLDGTRRRELSLRHRAASAVRGGASLTDAVRELQRDGAPLDQAVDLTLRAWRGGGLAREIVYLPAYLGVQAAFAAEPELEGYFRRGRISLAGARLLSEVEPALRQEKVITTGA